MPLLHLLTLGCCPLVASLPISVSGKAAANKELSPAGNTTFGLLPSFVKRISEEARPAYEFPIRFNITFTELIQGHLHVYFQRNYNLLCFICGF